MTPGATRRKMTKSDNSSWQTIDTTGFKPDYIDVPGNNLRSYGSSVVVEDRPERFALLPDARQLWFIKYFAIFFLPLFVAIAYSFIPGPERWIFVIGEPICGGFAFALVYLLVSQEIKHGPYFEYYPQSEIVRLPRYGAEVMRSDIECLQWITGGSQHRGMDCSTDVNLIVRTQDGEKRCYFLLGSPRRKFGIAISQKINIPVTEVILGARGKRDLDAVGRSSKD
jgi:hypothetical protein